MKLTGKITKRDDDKFLVFGWASMADVTDSQGDVISLDTLEKAAYDFVLHSRTGGEMHSVMGVASLVESIVFTPKKLEAFGLAKDALPPGWWVGFKVHDTETWQKIKNGAYNDFSIGGRAIREAVSNE
ncbi:MAG: hypothetical protein IJG80_09185 [Selenomonadaceae bacterium]|nr:hypothetical protein [Selenomonadaceae bacterium]MBQ3434365.1 hypothetical protein [Selenomonadaceae bacterium]